MTTADDWLNALDSIDPYQLHHSTNEYNNKNTSKQQSKHGTVDDIDSWEHALLLIDSIDADEYDRRLQIQSNNINPIQNNKLTNSVSHNHSIQSNLSSNQSGTNSLFSISNTSTKNRLQQSQNEINSIRNKFDRHHIIDLTHTTTLEVTHMIDEQSDADVLDRTEYTTDNILHADGNECEYDNNSVFNDDDVGDDVDENDEQYIVELDKDQAVVANSSDGTNQSTDCNKVEPNEYIVHSNGGIDTDIEDGTDQTSNIIDLSHTVPYIQQLVDDGMYDTGNIHSIHQCVYHSHPYDNTGVYDDQQPLPMTEQTTAPHDITQHDDIEHSFVLDESYDINDNTVEDNSWVEHTPHIQQHNNKLFTSTDHTSHSVSLHNLSYNNGAHSPSSITDIRDRLNHTINSPQQLHDTIIDHIKQHYQQNITSDLPVVNDGTTDVPLDLSDTLRSQYNTTADIHSTNQLISHPPPVNHGIHNIKSPSHTNQQIRYDDTVHTHPVDISGTLRQRYVTVNDNNDTTLYQARHAPHISLPESQYSHIDTIVSPVHCTQSTQNIPVDPTIHLIDDTNSTQQQHNTFNRGQSIPYAHQSTHPSANEPLPHTSSINSSNNYNTAGNHHDPPLSSTVPWSHVTPTHSSDVYDVGHNIVYHTRQRTRSNTASSRSNTEYNNTQSTQRCNNTRSHVRPGTHGSNRHNISINVNSQSVHDKTLDAITQQQNSLNTLITQLFTLHTQNIHRPDTSHNTLPPINTTVTDSLIHPQPQNIPIQPSRPSTAQQYSQHNSLSRASSIHSKLTHTNLSVQHVHTIDIQPTNTTGTNQSIHSSQTNAGTTVWKDYIPLMAHTGPQSIHTHIDQPLSAHTPDRYTNKNTNAVQHISTPELHPSYIHHATSSAPEQHTTKTGLVYTQPKSIQQQYNKTNNHTQDKPSGKWREIDSSRKLYQFINKKSSAVVG